jgi:hypothetical protein
MTDQILADAQQAVTDILDALGVMRVVYVDDRNRVAVTVEDVIAAAVGLEAAVLLASVPELGERVPDDPDVLRARIREMWAKLEPEIQAERGQAVVVAARRNDGNDTDDIADVSILGQIVPAAKLTEPFSGGVGSTEGIDSAGEQESTHPVSI